MGSNSTCPMPSNINPLSPNGFTFSIQKFPELTYFCQTAIVPAIHMNSVQQATPLQMLNHPDDILTFDEIQVQFLVDESMANFKSVYHWMTALGFPDNYGQYSSWIKKYPDMTSESMKAASDGTLQILSGTNNIVATIFFNDLIPTSLGSLQFTATSTDVQYLVGTATFAYSGYHFEE